MHQATGTITIVGETTQALEQFAHASRADTADFASGLAQATKALQHFGHIQCSFAFAGASLVDALNTFCEADRRFLVVKAHRRMPSQLRRRGPRGRARVLKAARISQGFRWQS